MSPAWDYEGDEEELVKVTGEELHRTLLGQTSLLYRKPSFTRRFVSRQASFSVLSPSSPMCFLANLGGVLCFLLDVVFGPLQVFYNDASSADSGLVSFMQALPMCTMVFWTLTLPMGFITSFYTSRGQLEEDVYVVATSYLRTWFLHDLTLVVLDWLAVFSQTLDDEATTALRAVRFLRVLRALRINGALRQVLHRLRAGSAVRAGLRMCKFFLMLLLLAHLVACGWYTIGLHYHSVHDHGHLNWLDAYDMGERSAHYRLLSSWHWALAQFGPTKMGHLPTNTFERGFAVAVAAMAMVVNPFLVSKITSSMVALENLRQRQHLQSRQLFSYLHRHGVSVDLKARVCKSLGQVHEADNAVQLELKKLPMELSVALKIEIMTPLIRRHAVLCLVVRPDLAGAAEITLASDGAQDRLLSSGEKLFSVGQQAEHMHFIIRGQISYQLNGAGSPTGAFSIAASMSEDVGMGAWLSEQTLWLAVWRHCGVACAGKAGTAEVLSLSAVVFQRAFHHSCVLKRYARSFADSDNALSTDVGSGPWTWDVLRAWRSEEEEPPPRPRFSLRP